MKLPDPIPREVAELFDYLMFYAATGNLGVISTLDKQTGDTRFTLMGRHVHSDGGFSLVPLGFLSNTAGDEVYPPGLEPVAEFTILPERYDAFLAYQQEDVDRWADDGGACV